PQTRFHQPWHRQTDCSDFDRCGTSPVSTGTSRRFSPQERRLLVLGSELVQAVARGPVREQEQSLALVLALAPVQGSVAPRAQESDLAPAQVALPAQGYERVQVQAVLAVRRHAQARVSEHWQGSVVAPLAAWA